MKLISFSLIFSLLLVSSETFARRGGGGGGRGGGGFSRGGGGGARSGNFSARSSAPMSANRDSSSRNVSNRRASSDKDININRNVNVSGGGYNSGWGGYYPAGAAFAFTTTAIVTTAVIGDIIHDPHHYHESPSDCDQREVSGVTYTKCGEVWYKPMYNGTDVQYEVVKSPL